MVRRVDAGRGRGRQRAPAPLPAAALARALAWLTGIALVTGCLDGDPRRAEPAGSRAPRFEDSAASLEALGRSVLAALSLDDTATLRRLRLTETEHNLVVWPELPAARPEVNFPVDLAWTNIENRNRRGLERSLPLYRGRELRFEDVQCRGAIRTFATFSVRTDCWVAFSHAGGAEIHEAQIFKDVLVRGGGFKTFRYYDERPRPVADGQASVG